MPPNKWTIFATIFVGYAAFAYNRKGVSYAVPHMLKEGFEREHIGMILSMQNLAYLISKFMGGILSDRLKSRTLFGSGLFISGLATLLFSGFDDLNSQRLSWFLNGLAQGLGWPAIAKLLKNWFEPSELGTWWSLTSASSNLAGCIGPFVFTFLTHQYGWRNTMVYSGFASIGLGSFCYMYLKDSPNHDDALLSKKSANDKKKTSPSKTSAKRNNNLTMKSLLLTNFIWVISICYLLISTIKTGLTDWSQVFLINDRGQNSLAANSFLSSLEFGGLWGGVIAGFISDRLMRKNNKGQAALPKRGHPRMFIGMMFNLFTVISMYMLYTIVDSSTTVPVLNAIGITLGASIYGQIAVYGIVATESVVTELSGSAHAIAALCANFGSMLAGFPLTVIAEKYNWTQVFLLIGLIGLAQSVFMFLTCLTSYHMVTDSTKKRKDD